MATFKNLRYIFYILIFCSFFIFHYLLVNPIFFWVEKKNIDISISKDNLRTHVIFLTNFDE